MPSTVSFFPALGVYGFDEVEPLILAALVSEDPILLIGRAGTGKTYLLNSISEAMGVEHRHYNASLISFDDLVGFPYPDADGRSISFLPTPATIWQAQSVLVDEISRCKPETQNKFFSIIHERRVQGLALEHLRYRWAAMNPIGPDDGDSGEHYGGSSPLDPALADRFALVVEVPDWQQLSTRQQEAVIYPAGEAATSNDQGTLRQFVEGVKPEFLRMCSHPTPEVVQYARLVCTLLTDAGLRMSPRRARLLARNLTAAMCVWQAMGRPLGEAGRKALYKRTLGCSLPHRAWKEQLPQHVIDSAHAEAIRLVFNASNQDQWISEFLMKPDLSDKLRLLFESTTDADTRSLAVIQMLHRESKTRKAMFAMSLYPLAIKQQMLQEEALQALAHTYNEIAALEGEIAWDNSIVTGYDPEPIWAFCEQFFNTMSDTDPRRRKRARQFFRYLVMQCEPVQEPSLLEADLQACFKEVSRHATAVVKPVEIYHAGESPHPSTPGH